MTIRDLEKLPFETLKKAVFLCHYAHKVKSREEAIYFLTFWNGVVKPEFIPKLLK
jgi:hypothetical protein